MSEYVTNIIFHVAFPLSYNPIRSIGDLTNLPHLQSLKLKDCNIVYLLENDWQNIPSGLRHIDFSGKDELIINFHFLFKIILWLPKRVRTKFSSCSLRRCFHSRLGKWYMFCMVENHKYLWCLINFAVTRSQTVKELS